MSTAVAGLPGLGILISSTFRLRLPLASSSHRVAPTATIDHQSGLGTSLSVQLEGTSFPSLGLELQIEKDAESTPVVHNYDGDLVIFVQAVAGLVFALLRCLVRF